MNDRAADLRAMLARAGTTPTAAAVSLGLSEGTISCETNGPRAATPRATVRVYRALGVPLTFEALFPGGPLDAAAFLCPTDPQGELFDLAGLPELLTADGYADAQEAPRLAARLMAEERALLERAASWGRWGVRMAVAWVLR